MYLIKRFGLEKSWNALQIMRKSPSSKQKKSTLNDLIIKLDKTGSTDRSSATGRPCYARTRKHRGCLTRRSTSGWTQFHWSLTLEDTMYTIFTNIAYFGLCQTFLQLVNDVQSCVIFTHICLLVFYFLNYLNKMNEFVVNEISD